jgi:hypothetical protein
VLERVREFRDAPIWDERSSRRVVWLILATMVPAAAGFAIAFSAGEWLTAGAVWLVMLIVDVAIMLAVRGRLPKRH